MQQSRCIVLTESSPNPSLKAIADYTSADSDEHPTYVQLPARLAVE